MQSVASVRDVPLEQDHEYFLFKSTKDGDFFFSVHGTWTPSVICAARFTPLKALSALGMLQGKASLVDVLSFLPVSREPERGSALLIELLFVSAILVCLAALALPNAYRARLYAEQATAKERVSLVSRSRINAENCGITPGCNPASVQAFIPSPGSSMDMTGYRYTMSSDGQVYTAAPLVSTAGQPTISVGPNGVIFCGGAPCN